VCSRTSETKAPKVQNSQFQRSNNRNNNCSYTPKALDAVPETKSLVSFHLYGTQNVHEKHLYFVVTVRGKGTVPNDLRNVDPFSFPGGRVPSIHALSIVEHEPRDRLHPAPKELFANRDFEHGRRPRAGSLGAKQRFGEGILESLWCTVSILEFPAIARGLLGVRSCNQTNSRPTNRFLKFRMALVQWLSWFPAYAGMTIREGSG